MADPDSDLLESPSEGQFSPNAPTPLPVGAIAPTPLDYSQPQPGAMPNAVLDQVGPRPNIGGQIQQTYGEYMAARQRAQEAQVDRAQAVEQANEGVREAMDAPRPEVPKPLQLAQTPQQRIHEFLAPVDGESPEASISKMINAMGLFAQMGGAIARGHAASGVAALSGAMQGWNAGQVERAQLDFRKWQMETRKAIEEKNSEFQQYAALRDDRKLTIEERLMKSQMVAYEKGNYAMAEQFTADTYGAALGYLQQERNHLDQVQATYAKMMQSAQEAAANRESKERLAREATESKQLMAQWMIDFKKEAEANRRADKEAAKAEGKLLPPSELKLLRENFAQQSYIKEINDLANSGKVDLNKVLGGMNPWLNKIAETGTVGGIPVDPKFLRTLTPEERRFLALTESTADQVLRDRSGAAVTDHEFTRMLRFLASSQVTPDTFVARTGMTRDILLMQHDFMKRSWEGYRVPNMGTVPSLSAMSPGQNPSASPRPPAAIAPPKQHKNGWGEESFGG